MIVPRRRRPLPSDYVQMEIDRDTYDSLPVERIPKDEPARNDYLVRQLAAARGSLSLLYARYPDAPREFTRFQIENAAPLFGQADAAGTMHWTLKNPMGS